MKKIIFFLLIFFVLFSNVQVSMPLSNSIKKNSISAITVENVTVVSASDFSGASTWIKKYEGDGEHIAYSVALASDGGYVVAGSEKLSSTSYNSCLVFKVDSKGNLVWAKRYSATYGVDIVPCSIIQAVGGGFIVAGTWKEPTNSSSNYGMYDADVLILKLSQNGGVEWSKLYGGSGEGNDMPHAIKSVGNNGYIIVGETSSYGAGDSDCLIINIGLSGDVIWSYVYGGVSWDGAFDVQPLDNDTCVVVGGSSSFGSGGQDGIVFKIGLKGQVLWSKTFGRDKNDVICQICTAPDNGYVLVMNSESSTGSPFIIKINANGNLLWAKACGIYYDNVFGAQRVDDGYILSGYGGSFNIPILFKVDFDGNIIFARGFYGGGLSFTSVKQTKDGNYVSVGYSRRSDRAQNDYAFFIAKTNLNGNVANSADFQVLRTFAKEISVDVAVPVLVYTKAYLSVKNVSINASQVAINPFIVSDSGTVVIVLHVGDSVVSINGETQTLDSPPIIKNGRTLLPIRPVIEALGGEVSWDPDEQKVTISLGANTIELWIDEPVAVVNFATVPIDSTNSKVVPEIINGRTMLPLRFVTENLGCNVQWNGATKTITITF